MITAVGSVTIYVKDQERAKAFYTEKLGMAVITDAPMPAESGTDARWIALAPPGSVTEVVLYQAGDPFWEHYAATVGAVQAITLLADDLRATVEDLRAKGVKIVQAPEEQSWGSFAMIEDSEGNTLIIVTAE